MLTDIIIKLIQFDLIRDIISASICILNPIVIDVQLI